MLGVVAKFVFVLAVFAACDGRPSSECDESDLLQTHRVRKTALQLDASELLTFDGLKQHTAKSFERASKLRKRNKLLIEQDLASKHQSKHYQHDATCMTNALEAFEHFLTSSKLHKELTDAETSAFRERVLEEMQVLCKHQAIDLIPSPKQQAEAFQSSFQAAVAQEMPAMSQRLFEVLRKKDTYSLGFPPWLSNFSAADLRRRTGILQDHAALNASLLQTYGVTDNIMTRSLPASFESAARWPKCSEIIGRIHNQGHCGSCWAFAGASALDARLCIVTEGLFSGAEAQLSRGFLTSCAVPSGDGCLGGWTDWVYDYMATTGSPTGGDLGCHPYFGHGDGTEHFEVSSVAPPCPTQCGNMNFGRSMQEDKFKLATSKYIAIASFQHPHPERVYHLAREALLSGGPVPAYMYADAGFLAYTGGVYMHGCDQPPNHAVTVLGYGPDYWHGVNSWGDYWGMAGAWKVGICVLTDFQIPSYSLAGASGGYSFPLSGRSATPAPNLNPSAEYPAVKAAAQLALPVTKDRGCACSTGCANHGYDLPGGVFCWVQDPVCQGTNWGYCEYPPEPEPQPEPPTTTTSTSTTTSSTTTTTTTTTTSSTTTSTTSTTTATELTQQIQPKPPTTTTSTTTDPTSPPWDLLWGDCGVDAAGCITSPNYDPTTAARYPANSACRFNVKRPAAMEVEDFNVEEGYDFVTVNGLRYSGSANPHGKVPHENSVIDWYADYMVQLTGFKICPRMLGPCDT